MQHLLGGVPRQKSRNALFSALNSSASQFSLLTILFAPPATALPSRSFGASSSSHAIQLYDSLSKKYTSILPGAATSQGQHVSPITTWYSCGPTVYDSAHLGHARTYVCTDIVRRVLEHLQQQRIQLCMGITDIDDKIIARAQERGVPFQELARHYEQEFLTDMAALNVLPATVYTRVTEHVENIISYVEGILARGGAYVAPSGSVYMDTQAMGEHYGKLGPQRAREGAAGTSSSSSNAGGSAGSAARESAGRGVSAGPVNAQEGESPSLSLEKRHPSDFVLWKASKSSSEPSWQSPWGLGRPGWHIECSAMSHSVLGSSIDLHSGGVDLAFPHHCNEIAQSEVFNGVVQLGGREAAMEVGAEEGAGKGPSPCCGGGHAHTHTSDHLAVRPQQQQQQQQHWVRQWLHTGHLHIQGLKMSKSLKNFITVRDMLQQCAASAASAGAGIGVQGSSSPSSSSLLTPASLSLASDIFRVFCLSYAYSANVSYSEERLTEARQGIAKLQRAFQEVEAAAQSLRRAGASVAPAAGEGKLSLQSRSRSWGGASSLARDVRRWGGTSLARDVRRWGPRDFQQYARLQATDAAVLSALRMDVDTAAAMRELQEFAAATRSYLSSSMISAGVGAVAGAAGAGSSLSQPFPELLLESCSLLSGYLSLFGLQFHEAAQQRIEVALRGTDAAAGALLQALSAGEASSSASASAGAAAGASSSAAAAASDERAVQALVEARTTVRKQAVALSKALKALSKQQGAAGDAAASSAAAASQQQHLQIVQAAAQELLALSDSIRSKQLPSLGWELTDGPEGPNLMRKA